MTNTASDTRRHRELTQLKTTHQVRQGQKQRFLDLVADVEAGRRSYVLADGTAPHELFEAGGLAMVTDVWYSGVVAAKRQSAHYSDVLAAHGYHHGLNRYHALGLGVMLDDDPDREKPWGGLPPPAIVVGRGRAAIEQIAHLHDVPYVVVETPTPDRIDTAWWRSDAAGWEIGEGSDRIDMMVAQYRDVIDAIEHVTGQAFDLRRLRRVLELVNALESEFRVIRDLLRTAPKLPVRLGEVLTQVMGLQWHRGTTWALEQARAFRAEVQERIEREDWVCPHERLRLMYIGEGLWQQTDFFSEFEDSHGVVFPRSNYLSFAADSYRRFGLQDPVRALASRYATFNSRMHLPPWGPAWAVEEALTHRIDGAILLEKGEGRLFIAEALERAGIPVLRLAADSVDGRRWDPQLVRDSVVQFLETRFDR